MSTQKNLKNWELKNNSLKERIEFLMTPEELEKPYSFASRVGLPKGTFTGIWINGRQSLHKSTIDRICQATGANAGWLATGYGQPYDIDVEEESNQNSTANHVAGVSVSVVNVKEKEQLESEILDASLLQQAFNTLDQALEATGRVMQPKGRARFVATVYASLKENEEMDTEVLQDCILTVEEALKSTRRTMSPKAKTDLILVIYELYSGNASYKEAMTSTINQLIRSVSKNA
jgi:hypothetical protein